jgi:rubrerythrin
MSFAFNADEIFAMAEEIEKNGAQFYRKSAQLVKEAAARDLLLEFASMEDEHLKTFSGLRLGLSEAEKKAMTFDPANEAGLYLMSLANTKVFFEKKVDTSRLEGIFKAALTAEKESIVFYLGLEDMVLTGDGKNRIQEIIREEMRHIRILGDKLHALKK